MNASAKPMRKPEFRLETVDQEIMLYDPTGTRIIYCNPTAALIWQLCDGQRTLQDLVALLQEAYPDAAPDIPADVTAALQDLANNGCIELA